MLERPDKVKEFVARHDAPDGTVRQTAVAELEAMGNRPSQWNRSEQVPEKSWAYKVAKKYFYTDFGAYRNLKGE